jgi:hypothetical protein
VVIDAGDRHSALGHGAGQHAQAAEVGDVHHHDDVGPAQGLDRLAGPVGFRHIPKQEIEAGRRRRRIGDHRLDAQLAKQQDQADFTAQAVAVRIDVGGETDAPPRHQQLGQGLGGGQLLGGEGDGHGRKVTA